MKLRNMTCLFLTGPKGLLCLYRIGSRVADRMYVGAAGGHFEKDELNDARLAALAAERVLRLDPSTLIPEEKVWKRLGITDDDLTMTPEVEFE